MNYQEAYDAAKKAGKTESLATQIYRFEEVGDSLVGKVLRFDTFTGQFEDAQCIKYTLDTDGGLVSCILGAATDEQLGDRLKVGMVVAITYRGKAKTAKGFNVNQFEVVVISTPNKKKG